MNSINFGNKPADKIGDIVASYCHLFYEIMDQIYQQIEYRFTYFGDIKFLQLCALVERCWPTLKRFQIFVRNSTDQDRLYPMSLLYIENNLIQDMSEPPHFYDEVIEEFAKKDRRIDLHYK